MNGVSLDIIGHRVQGKLFKLFRLCLDMRNYLNLGLYI